MINNRIGEMINVTYNSYKLCTRKINKNQDYNNSEQLHSINSHVITYFLSCSLSHLYVSPPLLSFASQSLCNYSLIRCLVAFCLKRGHQLAGTTRSPWLTSLHSSSEISKIFLLKCCYKQLYKIYLC